ncbi:hypothetical protein [Dactylosporangium sp. CA-092794]|uniref:hypothetical protein n=1 Tax=Dactylosporangium sp. CA-092794 TaxID=3239929 RepID=UPI003D94675E
MNSVEMTFAIAVIPSSQLVSAGRPARHPKIVARPQTVPPTDRTHAVMGDSVVDNRGVAGGRMAIGSEQRRKERRPRIARQFDPQEVEAALDLLALTDMAWHDCYGPRELEIPALVLDDMLLLAHGNLAALIRVAQEAVMDFRDVRMSADDERAKGT